MKALSRRKVIVGALGLCVYAALQFVGLSWSLALSSVPWTPILLALCVAFLIGPELSRLKYTVQRTHSPMVQTKGLRIMQQDYRTEWTDDVYDY